MDNNIDACIGALFDYAVEKHLCEETDRAYMINGLLSVLGRKSYVNCDRTPLKGKKINEILGVLCDYAVSSGIIENDSTVCRDLLDTKLMGVLTPRPSEVIGKFYEYYRNSHESATDYFYSFCRDCDYIRTYRICKDIRWKYPGKYGNLDITINLSKPEKDPRMIAAAGRMPATGYPSCALCHENEGFEGDISHAARETLRQIPIWIGGTQWYLQYSPYSYYNEHCIALSSVHSPMKIDRAMFAKLLDFIGLFPHYFIGSNADLPIVGGSILSHDHMQGGRYTFAMTNAPIEKKLVFDGFENVESGLVRWPLTTIRLRSDNQSRLVDLADKILRQWRNYSDPEAGILSESDSVKHNTITPIARKAADGIRFELDLVLRCNIVTPEHPLGVFHPHKEKHHIKKENIGLIEVMGLAVLPPRLRSELARLETALINGENVADIKEISSHSDWADELRKKYVFTPENTEGILKNEVGKVFETVLEDAGVYKCTQDGRESFMKFIDRVNGK